MVRVRVMPQDGCCVAVGHTEMCCKPHTNLEGDQTIAIFSINSYLGNAVVAQWALVLLINHIWLVLGSIHAWCILFFLTYNKNTTMQNKMDSRWNPLLFHHSMWNGSGIYNMVPCGFQMECGCTVKTSKFDNLSFFCCFEIPTTIII